MSRTCISHVTSLSCSVLTCGIRELDYIISKCPSGSDILGFICRNIGSHIKDPGSKTCFYVYLIKLAGFMEA